jgi:uncharacterized membrane protein
MSPQLSFFLWLAVGVFAVAAIVQLLFPVEVYEKARESNLSASNKGRFAYTVESLYQIKTKGFDAEKKYWWHMTWFNTTVSLSISAIVVFGTLIIIAIVVVIFIFIVLAGAFGQS